jgi:predicted PurR-regulated permease PerM
MKRVNKSFLLTIIIELVIFVCLSIAYLFCRKKRLLNKFKNNYVTRLLVGLCLFISFVVLFVGFRDIIQNFIYNFENVLMTMIDEFFSTLHLGHKTKIEIAETKGLILIIINFIVIGSQIKNDKIYKNPSLKSAKPALITYGQPLSYIGAPTSVKFNLRI